MKLATFVDETAPEIGIVEADGMIPLSRLAPGLGTAMTALIANWSGAEAEVRRLAATATARLPLRTLHLCAPVPRPGKILAMGLNYRDHVEETGIPLPKAQIWFCKQPTSASGPFDPIPLPPVSTAVDYEAEMVAVIGKGGRYIPPADAPSAVFGFCCGNDVSCRDWQMRTPQWILGKGFDGHAPFGPWIVTADEAGDPQTLRIRSFVNGAPRQDSNTRHMIYSVCDQVSYVSQVMTLEPGDILFTGTPGGVGMGMQPPCYLRDGDVVRVEIERLGSIESVCRPEAQGCGAHG